MSSTLILRTVIEPGIVVSTYEVGYAELWITTVVRQAGCDRTIFNGLAERTYTSLADARAGHFDMCEAIEKSLSAGIVSSSKVYQHSGFSSTVSSSFSSPSQKYPVGDNDESWSIELIESPAPRPKRAIALGGLRKGDDQ